MRTCSLLLVIVAIVAVVYPVATTAGEYWYPIEDIDQPHVQELGGWAVTEHERQGHDGLKFSEVTSGEFQKLVAGVKYHLLIDVLNRAGEHGRYEAELIEVATSSTRRLITFGPVR